LLIEHGPDMNRQGPKTCYTALHDAMWENDVDTARDIIDGGADLTLRSHDGETPLDFARAKHRKEIVAMLERRAEGGSGR